MSLADERFLLLTTFRRDGRAVATPVWIAPLGAGEGGFWTSSASGKAKRLRHTARVTVQPCDARGTPTAGSEPTGTTARLVVGPELAPVQRAIRAKYGIQARVVPYFIRAANAVRRRGWPYGDCGVVVALD